MKHSLLVIFLCLGIYIVAFGQVAYRIKTYDKKGEFILPPTIKSISTCKGNLKSKYYDFIITINNLNSNYNQCINNISKAKLGDLKILTLEGEQNDNFDASETKTPYCYITSTSTRIVIKIHFHKIFHSLTESNTVKACEQLTAELLSQISQIETKHTWAPSISQNIVQKIFELIPIPQKASLSRYGYFNNPLYSIFLLNPNMVLKCDYTSNIQNPLDVNSELMNWEGVNKLSFYRDDLGKIKQVPYLNLDRTKLPTNMIGTVNHPSDNDPQFKVTYYNIAGSADLELSAKITNSKYIALYQSILKSNNLAESLGSEDLNDCCVSEYDCNSQIVLGESLNAIFAPSYFCRGGIPSYENVAVYGERSSIVAFVTIYIDNSPILVPFGTTIKQLKSHVYLLENFKLLRIYNGSLSIIKTNHPIKDDIILLANDHLTTH